jgi:23S rRNA pseudouridine1911/1915/1917 synthase
MIIYEDENILAVNKPAGFLVHPAREGISKPPTLVDRLIKNYPEIKNVGEDQMRPGIVHRLDKDTSGILIIAKNQSAFEFLKKQFQERKIKKTYIALVKGRVKNKRGSAIFRAKKHMERFLYTATNLGFCPKISVETLINVSKELIRLNEIGEGYIRPYGNMDQAI